MKAESAKTPARPATKKAAKKRPRAVAKGYMGKTETVPLAIAARAALDFQIDLGNEDRGTDFNAWRRAQVKAITGREGLTDCLHEHYRPLMAHFLTLQGKDDKAIELFLRTGTASKIPGDTVEAREKIAREIHLALNHHTQLHDRPWTELLDVFAVQQRDDKWIAKAMDRKIAIEAAGGPIREGYLIAIVRAKTKRPNLTLGPNLEKGLAERCTVKQLDQILATIVNRINAKEGIAESKRGRNTKQKTKPEREKRSKKTLAPRFELPGLQDPCN